VVEAINRNLFSDDFESSIEEGFKITKFETYY
jgi:hypothetical protein